MVAVKEIHAFERQLKALGSARRLAMLKHLKQYHSATVSELSHAADIRIFATSQHLRILRAARIVTFLKRGLHVTYRLSLDQDPLVREVLRRL